MALRRLRSVLRRSPPEPVFPLTFLRDIVRHVFMHIVDYVDVAGLAALARTHTAMYKCIIPILVREKMRIWNLLCSVNLNRERISLSFANVRGHPQLRMYCLCRSGCKEKPTGGDLLKSVFPLLLRMRHDLRRDDRINLVATDLNNSLILYRITSYTFSRCCDGFPLKVHFFAISPSMPWNDDDDVVFYWDPLNAPV